MNIVLASYVICGVSIFLYFRYRAKQSLNALLKIADSLSEAVREFESYMDGSRYFNDKKRRDWLLKHDQIPKFVHFNHGLAGTSDDIKELIVSFLDYRSRSEQLTAAYNEEYIRTESVRAGRVFDELGLDSSQSQREASVCDEDNTLIVSGAGTGKTGTILLKVAHLTTCLGVSPERILVTAFTKKVAEELMSRLEGVAEGVTISTFHAFGLSAIGEAEGRRPSVLDEGGQLRYIDNRLNEMLKENRVFKKMVDFFAYYFQSMEIFPGFENMDQYYRFLKAKKLIYTLRKENVRSQQEAMIANWLYVNGINYRYETEYEHDTADSQHGQYRPDFYLPDFGIYLEHFGIDQEGKTHFSDVASVNVRLSARYAEEMAWKREVHKTFGTTLVETYSFEFKDRSWKSALEKRLTEAGVALRYRDDVEIRQALAEALRVYRASDLFLVFLNLMKSGSRTISQVTADVSKACDVRGLAFLEIFSEIFGAYQHELGKTRQIDFNDMLHLASSHIENGAIGELYDYVIVDEFQDVSVSKIAVLKAARKVNPDVKFYCVGDDWQSIYRFTGSDVSLMTNFRDLFGFTKEMSLVESYRFSNEMAVITNEFIQKNPAQITKRVWSKYELGELPLQIISETEKNGRLGEILSAIDRAALHHGKVFEVFLLGRYNFNEPSELSSLKKRYRRLDISFMSMHKSKGLTADFVIMLDMISGRFGMPCEVVDDPILNYVLSVAEGFSHAEERRLMYVAMTRARHKCFLLTRRWEQSDFISEIEERSGGRYRCHDCGGKLVGRVGRFGKFVGCGNFPLCTAKQPKGMVPSYDEVAEDSAEAVTIPKNLDLQKVSRTRR